MIDTDKYEGHTPGPWRPYRLNAGGWTIGNLPNTWKEADKQLIADAPLLLAEVKRLRDFIQSVWDGLGEAGRSDTYQLFNTLPRSVVKLTKYNGEDE